MEIDVTALRSRDPDMVARGLLALAVIGLVGAWVQMPAAPRPAPILDGAIPAKVRRAVAWRAPGAWFSAGDIALAVGVERSQIAWTLRQLVDAGELEAKGTRNSRRYRRPVTAVEAPTRVPPQPMPEPKKPVIRIAAAPPETSNKAPILPSASAERSLIDEALAAGRVTRCPPAYAGTVEGGARLDLGGHQPIEKPLFRHPQRK